MSPKAIAGAGLSAIAIAIAASGCSGDSDPEAEFRAAFEKEFSAAPWYDHLTGIEVKDSVLEVTTDLGPESAWHGESEWDGTSGVICREAYGVAIETGAIDRGDGVSVLGRDRVGLIDCA